MANTNQSRKRFRQSLKVNKINSIWRSILKTSIKKFKKFIVCNDKVNAKKAFCKINSVVDKLVNKKIINKSKASRYKNRLYLFIKKFT